MISCKLFKYYQSSKINVCLMRNLVLKQKINFNVCFIWLTFNLNVHYGFWLYPHSKLILSKKFHSKFKILLKNRIQSNFIQISDSSNFTKNWLHNQISLKNDLKNIIHAQKNLTIGSDFIQK